MSAASGNGKGAAPAALRRLDSAVEFIDIGCRVGPVDGKNPGLLGPGWQHQWTRDLEVMSGWFERWPRANLGILPDRALIPVDVDAPCGYAALVEEAGRPPTTPAYLTGGGDHRMRMLFAFDERILGADRALAPGVQLRHCTPDSALMSVVPPGVHADTGTPVEWVTALDEAPLAPLPEAWLARVLRPTAKRGRPKSEWAAMFTRTFTAGCGETHPSFVSMAGRLVPAVGARATFELLRCWNRAHCRPPKDEQEIAAAVSWVAWREARR